MRVVLARPSACADCGSTLDAGESAFWDAIGQHHLCLTCAPAVAEQNVEPSRLDGPISGSAGASAAREHRRRAEARAERVQSKLGHHLGAAYLLLSDEPQSTRAWETGSAGERQAGKLLEHRAAADFIVLHDRRFPCSRANIDHLVVTYNAVFVIDTKAYRGRVERRNRGNLLFPDHRLFVGGRDRSKLVDSALDQAQRVKGLLATVGREDCPVVPILCFVGADWPLTQGSLTFDEVRVVWSKGLVKLIDKTRGEARLNPIRVAGDLCEVLVTA